MVTIKKSESVFCAQFEFRTETKVNKNLRLNEPEIIKISEFKTVLDFEHGSGNSK